MRGRGHLLAAGTGLLLLAAAVLVAGYAWTLFAWSGGEYATPPRSTSDRVLQALPWALGTFVLVVLLAGMGVFLLVTWRRRGSRSRQRPPGEVGWVKR